MATAPGFSQPSKWFSNKSFKLSLQRFIHFKPKHPSSPPPAAKGRAADDFREAFRLFDADGDGKISGEELRSYFAWAGEDVAAEEADRVIRDFDSDGDGLMDYGDFLRLVLEKSDGGDDEDLRRAFEMFEAEKGAGCITATGLQRVLSRLGDAPSHEECTAMIRAHDLDGNGVLDYHEFHRMMTLS